ncbi:hypothetical protein [Candidatus Thioglobus autotrophicus]|uniref:hypothetical protein n=1 Tax=Candidatus Thioglobus autotrophicus TaxID=1705394 RepID=UPI00299E45F4|nr:hypothetical protein [Candidatus Thioglobus autotrophicus]WPE16351.1 hypothetical protein R5P06_07310 [Candidatus Thioglobus autotrophicus]WPE17898.1 hypothetical protein R5P05_07465 [Candidatus Thioglobus autotrophicus]
MGLKKTINQVIFLLLAFFSSALFAKMEYVTVTSQGDGLTRGKAIQSALVDAIGQVNGLKIAAKTETSLSYSVTSKGDMEEARSSESLKEAVNSKTKGMVRNWSLISEESPSDSNPMWKVEIDATIAKYKISSQANRLRMAVVPFRTLSTVSEMDFSRLFSKSLNSYLTQSRRFAMIDRKYSHEQQKELKLIQGANFKTEEAARVGNQLGTDYLILGVIDAADKKVEIFNMRATNKSIKRVKTQIDLSFTILDVATGLIKHQGEYSNSFSGNLSLNNMAKDAANNVGQDILNAIYPILVLDINGDTITLGQGGKTMKVGDILKLIKYGDKITDPYTGESLGYIEIEIGSVKVASVQAKSSTARIFKLLAEDINERERMIVRPIKSTKENNKQEVIIKTEKELKKKSDDFDKDDDW